MRRLIAALCFVAAPLSAQEAPRVVADIAPIRALAAQVMEGVASPSQIIPTNASPHSYAMRPSEARALREADLVIWVGPELTHWLEEPLDTLSPDAQRLALMAHPGTKTLPLREVQVLEAKDGHDHDHDHDHHGETDPHAWLSPANAVLWAGVIAQKLAQMDPANAATYERHWAEMRDEIGAAEREITALLAPLRGTPFVVLHDDTQYFEASFGMQAKAFVIPGDGSTPGPATLKALREALAAEPVSCAFVSVQENDKLLRTVTEGHETRFATLDTMGTGEERYAAVLRRFADDLAACLSAQ